MIRDFLVPLGITAMKFVFLEMKTLTYAVALERKILKNLKSYVMIILYESQCLKFRIIL